MKLLSNEKIAVTSRSFSRHSLLREELQSRYQNVAFNDSGRHLTSEEFVTFVDGCSKAIVALDRIDETVLARLPQLSVISKYGVGLDALNLEDLARYNIKLGWTNGVNRRSVAELTLGLMLSLLRRISELSCRIKQGAWPTEVGLELTGKNVGIIGCGNIGSDLMELLQPFRCNIRIFDKEDRSEVVQKFGAQQVDLLALLEHSDIVSIHLPLNRSTQNLLNEDVLHKMRPSSFLINTSRGNIVSEQALKQLLTSHYLRGAACDVFSLEPPQDVELLSLPNFIPSPHIGGSTEESILAMGRAAIRGLEEHYEPADYIRLFR